MGSLKLDLRDDFIVTLDVLAFNWKPSHKDLLEQYATTLGASNLLFPLSHDQVLVVCHVRPWCERSELLLAKELLLLAKDDYQYLYSMKWNDTCFQVEGAERYMGSTQLQP